MTTVASVYKNVIISALKKSLDGTLSIQEIYNAVEKNIDFDDQDYSFVSVSGAPTKQLVWKRNLRNCLQSLKGNNTLKNDYKGFWSLSGNEIKSSEFKFNLISKFMSEAKDDDLNEPQAYARKVRKGGAKLRLKLLQVYQSKCCISDTGPENVLQAAHIATHALTGNNHSTNALLLRSDLHDLFDDGLLKINPENLLVYIHPSLAKTSYVSFDKKKIRKRTDGVRPSKAALQQRWQNSTW